MSKKVAVITGSSRGIGRALALRFAQSGYDILIHCNKNLDLAEKLNAEIKSLGQTGIIVQADISIKEEASSVIEVAYDKWGKIDVLINNAGITKDARFIFMKDEEWQQVINVNLNGVYNVSRSCIYRMIREREGCIINISSVAGIKGVTGQVNYCASKFGVVGFTKALAREVAPYNISVNCIAPGYIETDMTNEMTESMKASALKEIPMGSFGNAECIAEMAVHLASKHSKYITGQVICIDGGLSV
ncbi:3-oxoacyl-[acyl-carrier-protein] reductase [Fangia hongkongensis]|uniref:3-oxoacyl-[acyl-carrier-protein] reductase n=1 Tax=Fangia hongkongensis TaxID=270495 RepID=UPI000376FEF7|nr:3-oxoacyl-[acyl-carrier-protein] reductase [Fangia hongkongensis]MBK2123727.1 3-oxoacyl-[acyl-carrier-protein] reductase [Fangia hongkongensis]